MVDRSVGVLAIFQFNNLPLQLRSCRLTGHNGSVVVEPDSRASAFIYVLYSAAVCCAA
jgi:hypothetical protein